VNWKKQEDAGGGFKGKIVTSTRVWGKTVILKGKKLCCSWGEPVKKRGHSCIINSPRRVPVIHFFYERHRSGPHKGRLKKEVDSYFEGVWEHS